MHNASITISHLETTLVDVATPGYHQSSDPAMDWINAIDLDPYQILQSLRQCRH